MVGRALCHMLQNEPCELLTVSRQNLDLRNQKQVTEWMQDNRPDMVILAAAKVGGIQANHEAPAEFLYDNLMIEANVIHGAANLYVEKLLFLGSSCIYPKYAEQPIKEASLMGGALEITNQWYAIAKIAGVRLCQAYRQQYGLNFISAMPCNLYGPNDVYDTHKSHVIPALIMKMHQAKNENASEVTIWGTGQALREFLYVEDLAQGLVHLLKSYEGQDHINIGSGDEISIRDLAHMIRGIVGFKGKVLFDSSCPDGTPRKLLDNNRIHVSGWKAETSLYDGLKITYDLFQEQGDACGVAA